MGQQILKATVGVVSLGMLAGVAEADTLDDAITSAKAAGFSTTVTTRTETVSSLAEAKRLNQEEAERVKRLAERIQAQIGQAKTSDQSVRKLVSTFLTDSGRTETSVMGQNETVLKENQDAQKAYEARVKEVEAKNKATQDAYEAEKTRIAKENQEATATYETEKQKVADENAQKVREYEATLKQIEQENREAQERYEAELKKVQASNAEKVQANKDEIARITKENKAAQDTYQVKVKEVEAEKARLQAQYEADKARITNENKANRAKIEAENAKIEADYAAAKKAYDDAVAKLTSDNKNQLAQYEADLARITKENDAIDAENTQAQKDYEAKKAQVLAQNADKQKEYEEKLKQYQAKKATVESTVHTRTFSDPTIEADAKQAGITLQPKRVIDKGEVANPDFTTLQKEFEAESAKTRQALEATKKAKTGSTQELKDLQAFIDAQVKAIKAKIDEDNNGPGKKYHIRTVVKEKEVTGAEATKAAIEEAYRRLNKVVDDNRVRTFNEQKAYLKAKYPNMTNSQLLDAMTQAGVSWIANAYSRMVDINERFPDYQKLTGKEYNPDGLPLTPVEYNLTGDGLTIPLDLVSDVGPNAKNEFDKLMYSIGWKERNVELSNSTQKYYQSSVPHYISDYPEDSAEFKKEKADYEAAIADKTKLVDSLQFTVNSWNRSQVANSTESAMEALANILVGPNHDNPHRNQNNIAITRSSERVQYLPTKDRLTIADLDKGFDTRPSTSNLSAPQFAQVLDRTGNSTTEYTAIRIPCGESITVTYSLKNGQPYAKGKQAESEAQFVRQSRVKKGGKISDGEIADVYQVQTTITNNDAVHDGDMIAFIRNDTSEVFYLGVSNGQSPRDRVNWKLMQDPKQLMDYTVSTVLLAKDGEHLAPVIPQTDIIEEPFMYKGKPATINNKVVKSFRTKPKAYYVKADLESIDYADLKTMVANVDAKPGGSGKVFAMYVPKNHPEVPKGWENTRQYMKYQVGMKDGDTFVNHHLSFSKPHADYGARDEVNGWAMIRETEGFYSIFLSDYSQRVEVASAVVIPPVPVPRPKKISYLKVTGDLVREITLPHVASEPVNNTPAVQPVEMVVRYKEAFTEPEPGKPLLEKEPVAPTDKPKKPLPERPTDVPNTHKPPVKAPLKPIVDQPLPKEPTYPQVPKAPTPKVVPDPVDPIAELKKPKVKEQPAKPPLSPEPKKPEEKPLPTPPKLEELPKRPEDKAIVSGSNSFVVKSRTSKKPEIKVERVTYVAEARVSSGNSLVVRSRTDVRKAGSGNSFVVRVRYKKG